MCKISRPSKWVTLFIIGIYLERFCQGIGASTIGPTLLFLSNNLHTDVKTASSIFTGWAGGFLIGAIISSSISRWGKLLISLAAAAFLLGLSFLVIPFVRSLVLLTLVFTCFGIAYGYLEAGQQALILKIWGEEDSRLHVQGYHFGYTIGGIVGPMILRPFLIMGKDVRNDSTVCPGNKTLLSEANISQNTSAITNKNWQTGQLNPVTFAYIICAAFMAVVSLWYVWLGCMKTDTIIKRKRKDADLEVETRPQEKLKDVWWLIVPVALYYFFLIGAEHSYVTYIYSVAVCEFKLTESDGSILNTLFWSGMLSGRFIATLFSSLILPSTIILICSTGCLVSLVTISISGNKWFIPWFVSFLFSFFVAPLFPAGISWISKIINVSGKYQFVAYIGSCIGSMSLVPISGLLFQNNPMSVLYFSTGMVLGECSMFAIMKATEKLYYRRHSKRTNFTDLAPAENFTKC